MLISPHSDSHNIIAVKDPSVVNYNGEWYVAASTVNSSGAYGMEFLSFSNVYKVAGQNEYLLIVEAINSAGHRYFTSYTSDAINGSWAPLANTQGNPFIAASDVTFGSGAAWTQDCSSGEMIRSGYDQTLTISPCKIQYLFQGDAPGSYSNCNAIPWRIGLVTRANSTC